MSSKQDDQRNSGDGRKAVDEGRRTVLKGIGATAAVATAGIPGMAFAQGAADYGRAAVSADGYQVTDSYFGKPYIDQDEMRERPSPHRFIHGGFENTDT